MTHLLIWTIVGFAGTQYSVYREYDWRNLGEFANPTACETAAHQLNIRKGFYRCVSKGAQP